MDAHLLIVGILYAELSTYQGYPSGLGAGDFSQLLWAYFIHGYFHRKEKENKTKRNS